MSNCRGMIYGLVTSSTDGLPVSPGQVSLNFVSEAQGGPLKIGANDDLSGMVQQCDLTAKGEYAIPFYWNSVSVPDGIASAIAMLFYPDGTHLANNQHGSVVVCPDFFKQLSDGISNASGGDPSVTGAGGAVVTFILAASPELKGLEIITRFMAGLSAMAVEQQACYARIDFKFDLAPRVSKVGTKKSGS